MCYEHSLDSRSPIGSRTSFTGMTGLMLIRHSRVGGNPGGLPAFIEMLHNIFFIYQNKYR